MLHGVVGMIQYNILTTPMLYHNILTTPYISTTEYRHTESFSLKQMSLAFTLLGLLSRGKPHLKLLSLVIAHSRKPKERLGTSFGLDVVPLNKCLIFPTFIDDFIGKTVHKTRQQSTFGMLGEFTCDR